MDTEERERIQQRMDTFLTMTSDIVNLTNQNARLTDALRALAERDGLFIDGPGIMACVYCPAYSEIHGEPAPHAEDCPIAEARRLLAELGE